MVSRRDSCRGVTRHYMNEPPQLTDRLDAYVVFPMQAFKPTFQNILHFHADSAVVCELPATVCGHPIRSLSLRYILNPRYRHDLMIS